jgi:U32 family peptidase
MKRRIELLAPGGDVDSIRAAVVAGADAIYCGLAKFNARNRATNISLQELNGVLALAHGHDCKVYLTLNIIIVESDLPELLRLLNRLVNTGIDGVIVQDVGLLYLLSEYFPSIPVHASTQLTTHNAGQIRFLSKLAVTRVNLSRELSLEEITDLAAAGHEEDIASEVFVHGSYCISFSGICYMSSVRGARSGNRGRCSQPCRDRYAITPRGREFPLNLKDNSAYFDVKELMDAGVDAVKIEGRVKKFHYVYTVTHTWRQQLQSLAGGDTLIDDDRDLHKVFNRDFSNGYLMGDIHRRMFSDHPRNQSARSLSSGEDAALVANRHGASDESYEAIAENISVAAKAMEQVSVGQLPLTLRVSGVLGAPLQICVESELGSFVVLSDARLAARRPKSESQHLNHAMFLERLKAIDSTEYFLEHLELDDLQRDLFLPFREIALVKKKILFLLRGSKEAIAPVEVPVSAGPGTARIKPTLSVLISSTQDLHLCSETSVDLYFQLPGSLRGRQRGDELAEIFAGHRDLMPWFPSVLIGEDFAAAVELLRRVKPNRLVTDNTGIAYEAWKAKIPWIAGPFLNTANSHSLLCYSEAFHCEGAFLSNELSKEQIARVTPPQGFELYYSIYHPISLVTTRQCLFHQVIGCEKERVDEACLGQCERTASITDLKGGSLTVHKSKGNYASLYHDTHFLNADIVTDVEQPLFSGFLIDLRDIETETVVEIGKNRIIELFEGHLNGDADSLQELRQRIHPTSNDQYVKGMK